MTVKFISCEQILEYYKNGDIDAGIYLINKFMPIIKKYSKEHGTSGTINEDYLHSTIERILELLLDFEYQK